MGYLGQAAAFFAAAVVAVPLFRRLGLGSVLGYLAAGIVLGPWALHITAGVQEVLNFSELGVVLLLFVIGLELQPRRLWVLRKPIFGLGAAQVLITGAILAAIAFVFHMGLKTAAIVGLGLSLSSTAFAIQALSERRELTTHYGRAAFAILLFQDMAVIPLLFLVRVLAVGVPSGYAMFGKAVIVVLALTALIIGGRYLVNPLLRFIAGPHTQDVFTAAVLLVVLVAALLLSSVGLSMGMGAFLAGVLLADSKYRHELKADIEPFRGLLLGLFFMAVGMSVNLGLLAGRPLVVVGLAAGLIAVKFAVLYALGRIYKLSRSASDLAASLAQGGEFAFVLFNLAADVGLFPQDLSQTLILAVIISMIATPPLGMGVRYLSKRVSFFKNPEPFDRVEAPRGDVIIAGFGRMGQIIGRILLIRHIPFTALEYNPDQVEVVRRFGSKVYYGDASRLDLLRAARVDRARAFVLTISDVEMSIRTARLLRTHFPRLPVYARARNRNHAHLLRDMEVRVIVRETFSSSLELGGSLLRGLGLSEDEASTTVAAFRQHDERTLDRQHAFYRDESKLIQSQYDAAEELESLLESDREDRIKEDKRGATDSGRK
jgi:glutathione-regulated potassium-efflux system ancillary protein KefC/glutathione-regulated potassium-efflux system protein KefB